MIHEDDEKYTLTDKEYQKMRKCDETTEEDRQYMKRKQKESEEYEKKLDKETKLPEGAYYPGIKWSSKRKIKFAIKIALIIFFFFTPVGQNILINMGTIFFRDGSQFIVDTFTSKANEHGVFDYSKPISERVPKMLVIVMVPVILFVYLLLKGLMILVIRKNYRDNRLKGLITDRLEDYEYHQKLKRDAVYKDVYKY